MNSKLSSKKELILSFISENVPKQQIAKLVDCNIKTLDKFLISEGIDYKGNQGSRGYRVRRGQRYVPYKEYIRTCVVQSNKLRIKLLTENLKEYQCESCGFTTWRGNPIPLEVHHVDGDKTNNELCNLQLLCPNCHAQTSTYRGKNIKKK